MAITRILKAIVGSLIIHPIRNLIHSIRNLIHPIRILTIHLTNIRVIECLYLLLVRGTTKELALDRNFGTTNSFSSFIEAVSIQVVPITLQI